MANELTMKEFEAHISALGPKAAKAAEKTLKVVGRHAQTLAKRNAPRSPTQRLLDKAKAAKLIAKAASQGLTVDPKKVLRQVTKLRLRRRRKDTAIRPVPGGLERSIRLQMHGKGMEADAEVFVAKNAEAGAYAAFIHDQKGTKWHRRGIGTVAKGSQADDKYIKRAVDKAAAGIRREFDAIFDREI